MLPNKKYCFYFVVSNKICTSAFISGLPLNRTSMGFLFLLQNLLLFITVEADAHVSTMLPKDGEKAFLHVRRDVYLATPCLIKPATGIRRMGIEITGSARWDGIVNALESPRPYLLFCYKMIGTLLAFTHQMLHIEHLKGVGIGKRLDILRITGASIATCAGCHGANYTMWNILHTFFYF